MNILFVFQFCLTIVKPEVNIFFITNLQDGFKLLDSFLETTLTNYHAESVSTNFADGEASRALINDFVEKQTNGKIKDLIKSGVLTALTRCDNFRIYLGSYNHPFFVGLSRHQVMRQSASFGGYRVGQGRRLKNQKLITVRRNGSYLIPSDI